MLDDVYCSMVRRPHVFCVIGPFAALLSVWLTIFLCAVPLPQVVVLTQEYGLAYYHLLVENLSRITIVLDILLENPDIKVAQLSFLIFRAGSCAYDQLHDDPMSSTCRLVISCSRPLIFTVVKYAEVTFLSFLRAWRYVCKRYAP